MKQSRITCDARECEYNIQRERKFSGYCNLKNIHIGMGHYCEKFIDMNTVTMSQERYSELLEIEEKSKNQ